MQRLYCIHTSFSYRIYIVFSRLHENDENDETVKTSRNLLFTCQDNFNNLWLLLHRSQKFAFSVKTIRPHDNDIVKQYRFQVLPLWRPFSKVIVFSENCHCFLSFSCICKVKTQRKVRDFDENDMKTYCVEGA